MEPHRVERKLAAILHADVKGYSRLIGEDEVATLRVLRAYLEKMNTLVQRHGGHAVGSRGDSLLAQFSSVVEAVQCAVEMQQELKASNAELPVTRRVEFRIGINLGEIVVEGEQTHGEGINIAVRLEGLAEAGGIFVSEIVYEQVKNRLPLQYQYVGERTLKNIAKPVRVYRVRLDSTATAHARDGAGARTRTYARRAAIGAGLLLLVSVSVFLSRSAYLRFFSLGTPIPSQKPPSLPDEPSLAVLPFVNMSNDPQQDYFSDGFTEDLITDLSKVPGLFVVARNSAFTYKGKPQRAEQIGRELGVRYLLEGSARKGGDQVRITAQLVDTTSGLHIWAEHYDEPWGNTFKLPDEIRQKILFALKVKLSPEEQERFRLAPTNNMEAYDLFLRGIAVINSLTSEQNLEARRLCTQATILDPNYSAAYMCLSMTYVNAWLWHWEVDPQTVERAFAIAQRAVALDHSSPSAHMALGDAYKWRKQLDRAIAEGQQSIRLGPSCSACYGELAEHMMCVGRHERALELLDKAVRLDPSYTNTSVTVSYQFDIAFEHFQLGKHDQAVEELKQVLIQKPDFYFAYPVLVVFYADVGKEDEAREAAAKWRTLVGPVTIAKIRETLQDDPCVGLTDFNRRFFDALQRIGVSDPPLDSSTVAK